MKHLHKFASVLLALVMALSLMVPAFAAENETGAPDVSGDTTESTGTAHITVPAASASLTPDIASATWSAVMDIVKMFVDVPSTSLVMLSLIKAR